MLAGVESNRHFYILLVTLHIDCTSLENSLAVSSQFLLFPVVTFYKVTTNTELQ